MYQGFNDPYCYAGTSVLINRAGLHDQEKLDAFELTLTTQRFSEPLPEGRLGVRHYCAVHKHLFQDVYSWAGKFRTVRIARDSSMFCFPEHIETELDRIFLDLKANKTFRGLGVDEFARKSAAFLSDINAVHAFRDGNGRVQLAFLALVAFHAGHEFALENLRPEQFLKAMIASFKGDDVLLREQIQQLIN
jgi:cell filamentation protein